jgi:hypothetical protein
MASHHPRTSQEELVRHMLHKLQTPTPPLNRWEENFLSTISSKFLSTHILSEAEYAMLERIYSEKTE